MNTRAALTLLLIAGSAAQAQVIIRSTYEWSEVLAGTTQPVASPNGVVEPGEGALIRLNIAGFINDQDAIGQSINFGYPPPGYGIVRGLSHIVYNLVGTGGDATGSWNSRRMSSIFTHGINPGLVADGGARVDAFGGAQFIAPGSTVNSTNPINSAWRGVWNPDSYDSRIVNFKAEASSAVPLGQHNAVHVHFRTEYVDPQDPTTAYAVYWVVYAMADFGSGLNIAVGPGTGGAASCYVNCDHSTSAPVLNPNDFQCFLNAFAAGTTYANCDRSSLPPILNVNDFHCFLNRFAVGCL